MTRFLFLTALILVLAACTPQAGPAPQLLTSPSLAVRLSPAASSTQTPRRPMTVEPSTAIPLATATPTLTQTPPNPTAIATPTGTAGSGATPPVVIFTQVTTLTVTGTATPAVSSTANICLACSATAASLTASIPVTKTMQARQAEATRTAPTVIAIFTATARAAVQLTAMSAADCAQTSTVCFLPDEHFYFMRPIASNFNDSVDYSYRYGSTQGGLREPHHGVEFPNAQGTPVLAAGNGIVVFAGSDKSVSLAWVPAYYGNVIVIAHSLPGMQQTIFSLYAHLFSINVTVGQQVRTGQQIGQVGATGTAIGSHLHFEIRSGKNDYRSNRNPELWLAPLFGKGVLAGRIQNEHGKLLDGLINVQRIENGVIMPIPVTAMQTYVLQESQPVNGDDVWMENFAAGGLPAGDYRLTLYINAAIHEQMVKIVPGKLTFVRFVIK